MDRQRVTLSAIVVSPLLVAAIVLLWRPWAHPVDRVARTDR